MAFNKFMHPKNPYRTKKPNFKELALKYEEFRKHSTQDTGGKVHLDFKSPECLRALSWALLKDDFDIDVDMPLERLIPTIPLRLNYVLWLKDIIGEKPDVKGIDIGCGASCVYPLLAKKLHGWRMLATEVDDLNLSYARKNVDKNQMGESIRVVEVKEGSGLCELLEAEKDNFDFCMCNPPFFESNIEAYGLNTSRKPDRAEPKSVSTASELESIVEGGEVAYVQQMIADSLKLQDRIRVYTSMLGKKKSVGILKNELQVKKIKNFSSYAFCQGRTMRWGLAWSFDFSVKFPPCPFSSNKKPRPVPPLVFTVEPSKIECTVEKIGQEMKQVLVNLKIEHTVIMCSSVVWSVSVTARENTWSHARRKRREEARKQSQLSKCAKLDSCESSQEGASTQIMDLGVDSDGIKTGEHTSTDSENIDKIVTSVSGVKGKRTGVENINVSDVHDGNLIQGAQMDLDQNSSPNDASTSQSSLTGHESDGITKEDENCEGSVGVSDNAMETEAGDDSESVCKSSQTDELPQKSEEKGKDSKDAIASVSGASGGAGNKGGSTPLFKCWISIRKEKPGIILEMKWMDGSSREAFHQLFQHFKNHFK